MTNQATPRGVATTGAPATRVPRTRRPVAAVLVLLVVLGLVAGFRLSRPGAPAPAGPAAVTSAAARRPDSAAVLDARIATLEARLGAGPGDARAWLELGLAYHDKSLRSGELTLSGRAVEALDRARELRPDDPAVITARALVAASRHDFAGARALVEPIVAADPYASDARAVLVDACIELGLYDDAERHLDELGRLRPGQATLSRISYLRELQGDLPGALVAMRQAAATGPRDPWARATLHTFTGDLLLLAGRAPDALAELDEALAAVPDLPGAVASRAAALAALGRHGEAVSALQEHLSTRRDVAVASMLSELLGLRGEATTEPDRLIDEVLAAEMAAGYDTVLERADIELGRGNVETALALATEAHARRPDNVFAAEVLAYARHRTGDTAGALALVERSTRLDSADLHQHVRAAEILGAAGEPERARAQLRRAFELAPYPAPSLVAAARELAAALGVGVPTAWQVPVPAG